MNGRASAPCAVFILAAFLCPCLRAATVCEAGNQPLLAQEPAGITPPEIIQTFAAKETDLEEARRHYAFTQDMRVDTLDDSGRSDGSWEQVWDVRPSEHGAALEELTFAPQSTLRGMRLSEDDLDDMRTRLPFWLPTKDLPLFRITYAGRQRVDELDTYAFDVIPVNAGIKDPTKQPKRFEGRIWVDARDLVIVKTCGRPRPSIITKRSTNLVPQFVTYREQIDGRWFPTYIRANESLEFPNGRVRMQELIRYTNYKLPDDPK